MAWYDAGKYLIPGYGQYAAAKDLGGALVGGMTPTTDPGNARLETADSFLRPAAMSGFQGVEGRQAPQMQGAQVGSVAQAGAAQLDPTQQAQFRQQQQGEFNRLAGIAGGTQMGAGEMAVQRGVNRAVAGQHAAARMGRGSNAAIAQRAGARNMANIGVTGAGQMGQARFQDQQAAGAQLMQGLGQARGQDIGLAQANAQLMQQTNLANMDAQNQAVFQQAGLDQATSLSNMQARLQMQGMNDQAALNYLSLLFGIDQAEMLARLGQEKATIGGRQEAIGGLLQTGGTIGTAVAMSDRNAKRDIRGGDTTVQELLDLQAYEYEYRDPKHGQGAHVSLMAQDLERTKLGRGMVVPTAEGKAVDYGKGFGALLAGLTQINRRLKELEGE